jgi:hypothetical protein
MQGVAWSRSPDMSDSESATPACAEKARLLNRCAVAQSEYNRSIQLMAWRIGGLRDLNFEELADLAKNARKPLEEAQEALERHTAEHGC